MEKLHDENFAAVTKAGCVLVDFYREVGCQYCRMLEPILEQLAHELQGSLTVVKVDVFAAPKTTNECDITSVPTLVLFQDGKPVKRLIGLQDLKTLKEFVK